MQYPHRPLMGSPRLTIHMDHLLGCIHKLLNVNSNENHNLGLGLDLLAPGLITIKSEPLHDFLVGDLHKVQVGVTEKKRDCPVFVGR
ncbi:hypothetical protein BC938DRAFT_472188 [Jimgerdemannia flammicorona]|uniref:Uncharacterized protein n=1 Tax=Jimgerdemannia flammicorona TaxID=994334 RepID=A0A433Q6Q3_9FUNG|nr:hypothetical protein BC938DRAFT_472188 [Jimgerdemannia flammicorona]